MLLSQEKNKVAGESGMWVLLMLVAKVSWVVTKEEFIFNVESNPIALVMWDNEMECKAGVVSLWIMDAEYAFGVGSIVKVIDVGSDLRYLGETIVMASGALLG